MLPATIIFLLVMAGFIAQLIDGALGMAYGVTSNTLLLSIGFTPAIASASVHTSEIFTSLASGISHLKLGNVDRKLFINLAVPGSIAAIAGAYILTNFPVPTISKAVSIYLTLMGGVIILRAFNKNIFFRRINIKALGLIGGLLDAMGGGGWGPIVTSTLIANGQDLKKTVGSVNTAEFFVTLAQSITFHLLLGFTHPEAILALITGGIIASPIAAYLCKKAPTKTMLIIVGLLILTLNLRTILFK